MLGSHNKFSIYYHRAHAMPARAEHMLLLTSDMRACTVRAQMLLQVCVLCRVTPRTRPPCPSPAPAPAPELFFGSGGRTLLLERVHAHINHLRPCPWITKTIGAPDKSQPSLPQRQPSGHVVCREKKLGMPASSPQVGSTL
jgi:hypothetical protein